MKKLLTFILILFSFGGFAQSATATLTANGSDSDGTIASYQWTKVSGGNCTIVSPALNKTDINFTIVGTYVFQCTVKDNDGATASATATVIVTAANTPPTVVITPNTITVQLK